MATNPTIPPDGRTTSAITKDQAANVNVSPGAKNQSVGPFKYPIHNADRYEGKITFLPIEVNIPKFAITGENFRKFLKAGGEVLKESENTAPQSANDGDAGEAEARANTTNNKSLITYTAIPDQKIILNLPVAYIVNDAIGYDNTTE